MAGLSYTTGLEVDVIGEPALQIWATPNHACHMQVLKKHEP